MPQIGRGGSVHQCRIILQRGFNINLSTKLLSVSTLWRYRRYFMITDKYQSELHQLLTFLLNSHCYLFVVSSLMNLLLSLIYLWFCLCTVFVLYLNLWKKNSAFSLVFLLLGNIYHGSCVPFNINILIQTKHDITDLI